MLRACPMLIVLLLALPLAGGELPSDRCAPEHDPTGQIDALRLQTLLEESLGEDVRWRSIDDTQFLRRASLDLIGRQPTLEELSAFLSDPAPEKRRETIEGLLASEEFGRNWANYFSDAISYRVPQPELTFLDYDLFKIWLAEQFNANRSWSGIVTELITAEGKVADNPPAAFVGFQQASATRLAGESARLFLGLQIGCAQCHDHPFDVWKQKQFHQMAAFFARAEAKLPWNDSSQIVVKPKEKGEHRMPADPGKKGEVAAPEFLLTGASLELEESDAERRQALARWIVASEPNFSRAFVNRVWDRLMGEGFAMPVDNVGEYQTVSLPEVFHALSDHFAGSGHDVKSLFRVVMNTAAYQQPLDEEGRSFVTAKAVRVRGDEVFDSLVTAVGLLNVTPEAEKPSGANRFPDPPKSTRDLVNQAFGFDPSLNPEDAPRTLPQAMFLMNNRQLLAQIDSDPASGSLLAGWLGEESDDAALVIKLYRSTLARDPNQAELTICLEHVAAASDRGQAFEDLLWSLINTAEFTTRR